MSFDPDLALFSGGLTLARNAAINLVTEFEVFYRL